MKILYLATRPCWPLTSGARIRDYHLARQLAARCSLSFVGLRDTPEAGAEHAPDEAGFSEYLTLSKERSYTPWKIIRGMLGPTPVTLLNCDSRRARRELEKILSQGEYDSVQVEGVHLAGYLPIIQAARSQPSVVVDWHNVESDLMRRYADRAGHPMRRLAARRTAQLLERAEGRLLGGSPIHTATSECDRQRLAARCPGAEIRVVPNGVDAEHFAERQAARSTGRADSSGEAARGLLFVGSMDYHANIDAVLWFCWRVWPRIQARHPWLRLTVVGRNPDGEVKRLASERIIVTGTVADVRPYYEGALASVVPIRVGGGTRLKILEAMAAGVPVISSRIGAEGLEVQDSRDILLADTEEEISAAVDNLVHSRDTYLRLSQAARKLVVERYDWRIIGEMLFRIHAEAAEGWRRTCRGGQCW